MGFFEQQDRARRATARLLVLYTLTVALIVLFANVVVVPLYVWWWQAAATPAVYATVSLVTLCVIALGSLEIMTRLSIGEGELGLVLAGRRVPRGSGIDSERRLINVVDEMAIASGLAAPPLYVLNREDGINAFAAGRSPNQAIVVVTKGALEKLSRDELQAVIAHEFGHILNGDIRLNLRAACALQGIVFLSAIGRFMMQYYSGYGTEEGRRFFQPLLAVAGGGLYGLGFVGLIGARLIQAAIAREREYLADACAVQYTRNVDALCGALARIENHPQGSNIRNWHAESLAHMLFAPNRSAWYATHPPLDERMRRANPDISPDYYFEQIRKPKPPAVGKPIVEKKEIKEETPKTIVPTKVTAVAALVASIGAPDGAALEYASGVLAFLPGQISEALRDAEGAQAVMVGMVIDSEGRDRQLRALEALGRETLGRKAEVLAPLIAQLDRAYRLPIVALALPVLRTELDEAGRKTFLAAMRAAMEADTRLSLGEFVLETILDWNLGPKAKRAGGVKFRSRDELKAECELLLSLLAHAGGSEALFARVAPHLQLQPKNALQLAKVSEALERLSQLAPLEKEPLLAACAEMVSVDGNVKLIEHELLRAIAAALDCPMPPSIAALDPRLLRK